jgi:hypothetical protein
MARLRSFCEALCVVAIFSLPAARMASAASIVDLVSQDSGSSNGALYQWTNTSPTGTGFIDSFLRIQHNGTEQGYNHSLGGQVPWDTKAGLFTHDIQMSDLVVRNINGVDYYEFLLDINESNGHDNEFLSLDNVQIFTREGAITSGPEENFSDLGTLRFNSDAGPDGDTTVNLDYSRNPGSGGGDMFLYLQTSLFAETSLTDYVYFYSLFGNADGSDAGFEEWALIKSTPPDNSVVPEPASIFLLGSGLALAARRVRERSRLPRT